MTFRYFHVNYQFGSCAGWQFQLACMVLLRLTPICRLVQGWAVAKIQNNVEENPEAMLYPSLDPKSLDIHVAMHDSKVKLIQKELGK